MTLTAEYLRELFTYDPETGAWTRNTSRSQHQAGAVAGFFDERGYARIIIDGRRYRAHRLAWLYMTGEWPTEVADHKNGNKSDNRWDNLRAATHGQNRANSRPGANNICGVKGVYFDKKHKRFKAQMRRGGKTVNLGWFSTAEAAGARYSEAANAAFGDFARGGSG